MLYPTDSILQGRRVLLQQMEAGTLTREQAFLRALELDPFDALALVALASERVEAGDLPAAAEYYWRAASADPCRFTPWFQLPECLPHESPAYLDGLRELGACKALRDPEGPDQFEEIMKGKPAAVDFPDGEALLASAADQLYEKRRDEPEEVSQRLRPHRLIDDLLELAEEGLDTELVDDILEESARCTPLLVGVLRSMATGSFRGHPAPLVASFGLLGEIGDPAVLPDLIECYSVDDEDVQTAAGWAVNRIVSRRGEESLDVIRKLAPTADAGNRAELALALSAVPDLPGKRDVLLGLLDGLGSFPKPERAELFTAVALGLEYMDGTRGRELAWSLLSRHAALLPKQTKADLREAFKIHADLHRMAPVPEDGAKSTVYDLCCHPWEDDDEEEEQEEEEEDDLVPEPIRRAVTPGRNDPCWCGSGKKYKKCHLASDEAGHASGPAAEDPLTPTSNAAEATLRGRLIDFAASALSKREMEESLRTFVGTEPPACVEDDSLSREALDWTVHDYVPARLGHSLIAEFLKRRPGGLTMRQRGILEAWSRSRFSIYEVQEVSGGSGVQFTDLLVGDEFFVHDVNISTYAVRGECYLARTEELEGRHFLTAVVLTILPHMVGPLKEWAIGARRSSRLPWDEFLRANSHRLRQEYSRLINRDAEPKKLIRSEGDELVFCNARYAVLDSDAVRRALDQSKALHKDDETGSYGWLDELEDAHRGRRAYGHVQIAGDELKLECQSRQRLNHGKELLEDIAGRHLRHLGDDFTPWQDALRHTRNRDSEPRV